MRDRTWVRIAAGVVAVAAVAGVARLFDVDLTVAALVLVVTLLGVGTLGLPAGMAGALTGFLAIDFLFTEPTGSFKIRRTDDLVALVVFTLSAALAGLAGATKALVFQIATLTDVFWANSGEVVLMALLGGIGTFYGPVGGAVFLAALDNYLASAGAWITITMGVIYMVCVMTFRRGLVGELAHRFRIKL